MLRKDCVFIADTGTTANYTQAIAARRALNYNDFYTAIYSQDTLTDDLETGKKVRVTTPFHLASKIPLVDLTKGIHWPFVGPRRGEITNFEGLSWNPTPSQKEELYRAQVNYIQQDPRRTIVMTQTTSQTVNSQLSDLSHVRALLRIQRDVENLLEDFLMEFINKETLDSANYNLNAYLRVWKDNGACEQISGLVYASDYDKKQRLARVKIVIRFTAILERFVVDIEIPL
jgi:hypothetical protein